MFRIMQRLIYEATNYGPGQTFLVFASWIYVLVLLIVAFYYAFLSLIKLIFQR
ncbi:hypothetical protein [Sporolactobacillus pectinivorans]|uniref:hypothetical protein n=1 Tax=Sporolactobacillus pectinivorans TaxID=1591408 RepID=UPI0012FDF41A|nr:hypothetical protein [Sporolactobacillus pectinivorans]